MKKPQIVDRGRGTHQLSKAQLGTLLHRIEAGVSPRTLDRPARDGEFGVLKVSAVTWGEFRAYENKALLPDFSIYGVPTVKRGDLLLSRANTAELLASPVLVEDDHPNLILSDKTLRLVPNTERVDPRFLLRALCHEDARHYFASHATGTSGSMRNVSQATINACPIPLPYADDPARSLREQKRIAAILDKADALRRKRQQAHDVVFELLHASFQDFFGDPRTNSRSWPTQFMGELAHVNRGKFTPRPRNDPRFYDGQYPFIQTGDISNSGGMLREWKQTLNELGASVSRSFPANAVVIAIVGATIGESAILDREMYCPDSVIGLVPFKDVLTPEYTEYLLRFFKQQFRDMAPETARANINLETLRTLLVPVPPLELQQRFTKIYRKCYSLGEKPFLAATHPSLLFDALVQRAFQGEL